MERVEELVARLQRLEMIHTVSRELNASLDAEALLPRVLSITLQTVGAEAGSLWLIKGDKIVCDQAVGGAGEGVIGLELPRGAGIVGSVAEKRKPEVIFDAVNDPRHIHQVDEATGFSTRSMITVPLVTRGQSLGALQVLNKIGGEDARFTPDDASLVQEIAVDAAAALRNASLNRTEQRVRELRALLRMSREITSTLDLDRILTTASNILSGIVPFDRCAVALKRDAGLMVAAVSGMEKVDGDDPAVVAVTALARGVASAGATVYSPEPDALGEEQKVLASLLKEHAEKTGMKAVFAVPLKDDTGTMGLLTMEAAREDFLEDEQRELVETFANQVAVALRNAELYRNTPVIGFMGRRGGDSIGGDGVGWVNRPWVRRTVISLAVLGILAVIPAPQRSTGTAEILPVKRHHLRPEVPLLVKDILVDEGQHVTAGDVLGHLRRDELEIQRSEVEAALRSAVNEAVRQEAAGQAAEAGAARARVQLLEAQKEQVLRRLEACTLVAPAHGIVLTRRPREKQGTFAPAGETLIEIAESGRWIAEILVPESEIVGVVPGAEVHFTSPSLPGAVFSGKAEAVGAVGVPQSSGVAFAVTAIVEDPDGVLRAGLAGRGSVGRGRGSLFTRLFGGIVNWFRWKTGV